MKSNCKCEIMVPYKIKIRSVYIYNRINRNIAFTNLNYIKLPNTLLLRIASTFYRFTIDFIYICGIFISLTASWILAFNIPCYAKGHIIKFQNIAQEKFKQSKIRFINLFHTVDCFYGLQLVFSKVQNHNDNKLLIKKH